MPHPPPIRGIHHITAIASDPQANHDFYAKTLGLRLVKKTVNFDDPGTYHLYFADEQGRPGTVLTFFPWPGARRGRRGTQQAVATAFLVPPGSLQAWEERLGLSGARVETPTERFGERRLSVFDPDDLQIDLVEHDEAERIEFWQGGGVSEGTAIRGFFGVTLCVSSAESTARLLTQTMGLTAQKDDGGVLRYVAAGDATDPGRRVDLLVRPDEPPGHVAAGTVHHVAFRVADDAAQEAWLGTLRAAGQRPTPIQERHYFRSIYFREPGGVLFEFATDGPGFAIDESVEALGQSLRLPPWLEPHRQ